MPCACLGPDPPIACCREDVQTAEGLDAAASAALWNDLASGAESGMDFSSRWLADGQNLSTIRTSRIVPTDLNAFLYQVRPALPCPALLCPPWRPLVGHPGRLLGRLQCTWVHQAKPCLKNQAWLHGLRLAMQQWGCLPGATPYRPEWAWRLHQTGSSAAACLPGSSMRRPV